MVYMYGVQSTVNKLLKGLLDLPKELLDPRQQSKVYRVC